MDSKRLRGIAFLFIIAVLGATYSCAPTKRAAYLRSDKDINMTDVPDAVYFMEDSTIDVIEPGDELFIEVTSGDDEPNALTEGGGGAAQDLELLSHAVDINGYVKLAYIDTFKVSGLTLYEAAESLEEELSQYLYMPSVSVRFINSRVAILGEVNAPGMYIFNRKKINVYQAIAHAGDIAVYGNRRNLMILRQEGDTYLKKHIDLTNTEVINSEWFYIQSNDIIYVESLGRRKWGMETFPYGLVFSLISTTVMFMTFSISLLR